MDEKEQSSFIRFLARELKAFSRELMAYQLLIETLKMRGTLGLEELLGECRQSPTLQKTLDQNFRPLEEILPPEDEDDSEKVKELLSKWKPPQGSPN